jgi:hypothetical protein
VGLSRDDVFVVGDTPHDVDREAINARTIAATGGYTIEELQLSSVAQFSELRRAAEFVRLIDGAWRLTPRPGAHLPHEVRHPQISGALARHTPARRYHARFDAYPDRRSTLADAALWESAGNAAQDGRVLFATAIGLCARGHA